MPYVNQEVRTVFSKLVTAIKNSPIRGMPPGVLNYLVTVLIQEYIGDHPLTYTALNETIGALECAKIELYRRLAVPYEEKKIEENGDVYREGILRRESL